jgi:hypothetical protein
MPKQKQKPKRWLTDNDKAEIILRKELRAHNKDTSADIARDLDCSVHTVTATSVRTVSSKVVALYEKKRAALAGLALDVTTEALSKGKFLIRNAKSEKSLSGIAAVGKFADGVYRLETHQPTEITQNITAEAHALEFIRYCMSRSTREDALEAFAKVSLEPLVPDWEKAAILAKIQSGELKLLTA